MSLMRLFEPSKRAEVRKLVGLHLAGLELEVEAPLPRDEPPMILIPTAQVRPVSVNINEAFIRELRAEYRQSGDFRTRRVGDLDDVRAWLDGLAPGQVAPRAEP